MRTLAELSHNTDEIAQYFEPDCGSTTLKVLHRNEFFMAICVQHESAEAAPEEGDLKVLNLVLNMAMVVVENVLLLSESQAALAELEKIHDQIVNLERVATQGIMSAEIGHELNNYLNIVRSNFELLQLKADIKNAGDIEKYMRGIEESLDQMTRFTAGLVDSAKLKSEKSEIDLNLLIEDIVSFLSPQKKYRKIKLTYERAENLPSFIADIRQLQQLFYNLLNNAAESFAGKPDIQPAITISSRLENGSVKVEVSDNGSGIPENLRKSMFTNRFTTKSSGHGFGLLVCKKVVENHNGTIEVTSTEGSGTTFKIEFPVL
jgi:signal transduction histidine kinase